MAGALISFVYLNIILIGIIYLNITNPHVYGVVHIYVGVFILEIPCILYILSWYFHRKLEVNPPKTEKFPDET